MSDTDIVKINRLYECGEGTKLDGRYSFPPYVWQDSKYLKTKNSYEIFFFILCSYWLNTYYEIFCIALQTCSEHMNEETEGWGGRGIENKKNPNNFTYGVEMIFTICLDTVSLCASQKVELRFIWLFVAYLWPVFPIRSVGKHTCICQHFQCKSNLSTRGRCRPKEYLIMKPAPSRKCTLQTLQMFIFFLKIQSCKTVRWCQFWYFSTFS